MQNPVVSQLETTGFSLEKYLYFAHKPNLSLPLGEMSRSDREGRLTLSYAQTKLVSPFGRDVAQRQRGLIPVRIVFEGLP